MVDIKLYGDSASAQKWVGWAKNKLRVLKLTQPDMDFFTKRYSLSDADVLITKADNQEFIKVFGKGVYALVVWLGHDTSYSYAEKRFFLIVGDRLVPTADILQYVDDGLYEIDFDTVDQSIYNWFSIGYKIDGGGLGVPAALRAGYDSKGKKRYILNQAWTGQTGLYYAMDAMGTDGTTVLTTFYFVSDLTSTSQNHLAYLDQCSDLVIYTDTHIIHAASSQYYDYSQSAWAPSSILSENYMDSLFRIDYFSYVNLETGEKNTYELTLPLYAVANDRKSGEIYYPVQFTRHARVSVGTPYERHKYYHNFFEPINKRYIAPDGSESDSEENSFRRTWDNTDPLTHYGYYALNIHEDLELLDNDDIPPDPPPAEDEYDAYSYHRYVAKPHARLVFGSYGDKKDYIEIAYNPNVSGGYWYSWWWKPIVSLVIANTTVESYVDEGPIYPGYGINYFQRRTRWRPLAVYHDDKNDLVVYRKTIVTSVDTLTYTDQEVDDIECACATIIGNLGKVTIADFGLYVVNTVSYYYAYFNGGPIQLVYPDGSPIKTEQVEYKINGGGTRTHHDPSSGYDKIYQNNAPSLFFINRGYDLDGNPLNHDCRFPSRVYVSCSGDVAVVACDIVDIKVRHSLEINLFDDDASYWCDDELDDVYLNVYIGPQYDENLSTLPFTPTPDQQDDISFLDRHYMCTITKSGKLTPITNVNESFDRPDPGTGEPTGTPYRWLQGMGVFTLG